MVKVMHFLPRNKAMTHDECIKYHREVHAPFAASLMGPMLKRYVAYYLEESPDMPFDLVVEQWFDDEGWKKMEEFHKTPEYQRLRQDNDKFLDPDKILSRTFEENVII